MYKIITSFWLWIPLSIVTLMAGYIANNYQYNFFTFDRSGAVLCIYGVVLIFIYSIYGPKVGALGELKVLKDGTTLAYIPGDEFKKHLILGIVITVIGTLVWAFGSSL